MASPAVTSRVRAETIGRAVAALLKWVKSHGKNEKAQLLENDELIYLVLSLKKIPENSSTNPAKIPLPHPLHSLDGSEEICLIFNDRRRGMNPLKPEDAKKKIQAESIPISKMIKLSKLKTDYRPFEAKRKLCGSYDLFFADRTILPQLPRLLGKHFFKHKKTPIPIDLSHKNWKAQIEHACSSALLYLRTGTCCILKVGKVSQGKDNLVENIAAAIGGAASIVPKGWANIRSFHLKSLESVALPLYQAVPEMGLRIEVSQKEKEVKKVENVKEIKNDESSTLKEGEKKKKIGAKRGRIHEVRYMDGDIGKLMEDLVGDDYSEMKEENDLNVANVASGKEKKKKRMADEIAGTEKKKNRVAGEMAGAENKKNTRMADELAGEEKKKTRKPTNGSVGSNKNIQKKEQIPGELKEKQLVPLKKTKSSDKRDTVGSPSAVMKKIKVVKSGEKKTKSMKKKM